MTEHGHWLWRLDAERWMAAAIEELERARTHFGQRRTTLTHLRRAAGMALNAVLVHWGRTSSRAEPIDVETVWGRSYLEHLEAVSHPDTDRGPLGDEVVAHARVLLRTPIDRPALLGLGKDRHADLRRAFEAATGLCGHCARVLPQPDETG